jgi:hypothetical protein
VNTGGLKESVRSSAASAAAARTGDQRAEELGKREESKSQRLLSVRKGREGKKGGGEERLTGLCQVEMEVGRAQADQRLQVRQTLHRARLTQRPQPILFRSLLSRPLAILPPPGPLSLRRHFLLVSLLLLLLFAMQLNLPLTSPCQLPLEVGTGGGRGVVGVGFVVDAADVADILGDDGGGHDGDVERAVGGAEAAGDEGSGDPRGDDAGEVKGDLDRWGRGRQVGQFGVLGRNRREKGEGDRCLTGASAHRSISFRVSTRF